MIDEQQAPTRLLDTAGPAGDCVRQSLARPELVQAVPRFALLRERRVRRARRQRGLSLVVLVTAALLGARALHQAEPPANIRAELTSSPGGQERAAAATSARRDEPALVRDPLPKPASQSEAGTAAAVKPPVQRSSSEALARSGERMAGGEPRLGNAEVPNGGARACAQLASSGAAEQALACYQALARGSGMVAELALFEQARLEGKVLRRPERALRTLLDYRRRFPNGSFRAEVMLAQIDWLLSSNDSASALRVVDEALGSGLLRERSAELERLRAKLEAELTTRGQRAY